MKKTVNKLTLKTDKITSLSMKQALQVIGGRPPIPVSGTCPCTGLCTTTLC
ncbi:MAG: class I lanthipeptide [Spirosomataceae bacterium]